MFKNRNNDQEPIKRPSFLLYLTEGFRALKELIRGNRFIKKYLPAKKGDGHPVLVIPGFMASDASTKPLRKFLQKIGFAPARWDLGRNYAKLKDLQALSVKVKTLYQTSQQKITLIGWSLGGVYARELAKENPSLIRQVITLGAPFGDIEAPNNATWVFNLINFWKKEKPIDPDWIASLPTPAPVPTTALYSKKDGIVSWKVCMEQIEDELHENIEVKTSHLGMGVDAEVLEIIADRLHYSAENWAKYQRDASFSSSDFSLRSGL